MITYGIERYAGRDERERTGELYARCFDGKKWLGKAKLVSEPGSVLNWYPSVNRDVRDGLCVMYSRSVAKIRLQKPLTIIVSVCDNLPPVWESCL